MNYSVVGEAGSGAALDGEEKLDAALGAIGVEGSPDSSTLGSFLFYPDIFFTYLPAFT